MYFDCLCVVFVYGEFVGMVEVVELDGVVVGDGDG